MQALLLFDHKDHSSTTSSKQLTLASVPKPQWGQWAGIYRDAGKLQGVTEVREARVRLLAAALNHRDEFSRLKLYPGGVPDRTMLGADGCGVVEDTSHARDRHWVGHRCVLNPCFFWGENPAGQARHFGMLGQLPFPGTFAEYITVPVDRLVACPDHLSDAEGAALPVAGATAYRTLVRQGEVKAGSVVLVTGIGGGVATMALQLAVALGCRVIVTSSSEDKIKRALQLGAVQGFRYTDENWPKQLLKYMEKVRPACPFVDCVIDGAGGPQLNAYLRVVASGGKIVSYGATAGLCENLNIYALFLRNISLRGSTMSTDEEFAAMIELVRSKKIAPVVDTVRPFCEIVSAFEKMQNATQFGKLVVQFTTVTKAKL